MRVLFVCHGNVNRSAAAEVIARKNWPEYEYKSCGLKTKDGKIIAKNMREVLKEQGYEEEIRSTAINQSLVDWADHIFYMDNANEKRFIDQFGSMDKALKLSNYIPGVDKIPDPAFAKPDSGLHERVVHLIQTALTRWISEK